MVIHVCQFHQMMIVRRYLTQNPELEVLQALLALVSKMTKMNKESVVGSLEQWCEVYRWRNGFRIDAIDDLPISVHVFGTPT